MDLPASPSAAFWSMFESQGELRGYANLFIIDPATEEELKKPEHPANRIREMWQRGSAVAARLGVVYLVSVMEAYATDLVNELLVKRIREVNEGLLNQDAPTSEDDDIMNEIGLEEFEMDQTNPFFLFSEIAKDYIKSQARHDSFRNSLALLEKRFDIHIHDRELHLNRWSELKKLRNKIVHHRASSRKNSYPIVITDDTPTIDEIIVSRDLLLRNLDEMHTFAIAIEAGIPNRPRNRSTDEMES
jgi:hypothetical protein